MTLQRKNKNHGFIEPNSTVFLRAMADVRGRTQAWWARAVGSRRWRRVLDLRVVNGVAQCKVRGGKRSGWLAMDGLSCIRGDD